MATAQDTPTPTDGLGLKLIRTARRLTVAAVAREAGWSRQRVSAIEASARPTARAMDRYMAAVRAASELADR